MKYYGTKNNKDYGFYEENFDNAIEITDEYWFELLSLQNEGKRIIPYNNNVLAIDENEYTQEDGVWKKLSAEEAKVKQLNIQNEIRKEEIKTEMEELDKKRIRALAEPSLKDEETTWLEYYNTQITALRDELTSISQ